MERPLVARGDSPWYTFVDQEPWKSVRDLKVNDAAVFYTSLNYHETFSTKLREPIVTPDIEKRLYEYIRGVLRERNSALSAAGDAPIISIF